MKKFLIGIDVSKQKLDVCFMRESQVVEEATVGNQSLPVKALLKKVLKENGLGASDVLICAEYTGQYIYPLCCACKDLGLGLWLENPAQIKYRSGVQRGKSDRLDAQKIAAYALRYQDCARLFTMPDRSLASLKQLISERDMHIAARGRYKGQLTDQKRFMDKEDYKRKRQRLAALIEALDQAISEIEKDIQGLIDRDEVLSNQHRLLCSIEGVGERIAVKMIVETNAFKDFKNPRKFCCHAGVAPFSYTSGSSQRSKHKVSNRADKSIKALLHMGALTVATRMNGELHEYYLRKVEEGKNKMLVINAIRAKLIYRMFAVIKNNQLYQKNYLNALA